MSPLLGAQWIRQCLQLPVQGWCRCSLVRSVEQACRPRPRELDQVTANRFCEPACGEAPVRFNGLADFCVWSACGRKQSDCSECPQLFVFVCCFGVLGRAVDQIIVRLSMSQRSEPIIRKYVDPQSSVHCGTLRWIVELCKHMHV